MADVITEFVNDPSVSYNELVAGYPIVTNTASEQAVVKDVVITNPNTRSLTLSVGDTVVSSVSTSAKLSGSEIVGASSTLNFKTETIPLFNVIQEYDNITNYTVNVNPTVFSGDAFSTVSTSQTTVNYTTGLSGLTYFAVFAANGDFYYGNNNNSIWRRAGGINGAETTITTTFGLAASYDGRYIYGFQQNNTTSFIVVDTQNNGSVVTRTMSGFSGLNAPDQRANSAAMDGYVWFHPNAGQGSYLLNGATGTGKQLGGASTTAVRTFVGLGKNSFGDYYGLQTVSDAATSLRWFNFGPSLENAYLKATGNRVTNSLRDRDSVNMFVKSPASDRYIFLITSTAYVFDLDNINTEYKFSGVSFVSTDRAKILQVDATQANTDFGSVGIRATGVKTTA